MKIILRWPLRNVLVLGQNALLPCVFAPQEQGESNNPQSDEHPEAFQSDCSVEGEKDHPS